MIARTCECEDDQAARKNHHRNGSDDRVNFHVEIGRRVEGLSEAKTECNLEQISTHIITPIAHPNVGCRRANSEQNLREEDHRCEEQAGRRNVAANQAEQHSSSIRT